jgi:hypothetical protein
MRVAGHDCYHWAYHCAPEVINCLAWQQQPVRAMHCDLMAKPSLAESSRHCFWWGAEQDKKRLCTD